MTMNDEMENDWNACPAGTLQLLARHRRTRKRRRFLITVGGTAMGGFLATWVGLTTIEKRGQRELNFGGIRCTRVRANAAKYMAGSLDDETSEQIRIHLEQCQSCQQFLKNMMPESDETGTSELLSNNETCNCPQCRRERVTTQLVANEQHSRA